MVIKIQVRGKFLWMLCGVFNLGFFFFHFFFWLWVGLMFLMCFLGKKAEMTHSQLLETEK